MIIKNIAFINDIFFVYYWIYKCIYLYESRKKIQLIDLAINTVQNAKKDLKNKSKTMLNSQVNINKHIVAFHDKFALGLSCIILFFVGAPLGALIRKGGIGLPLIIAILIFLTYHFISLFAKNSSEDSSIDPVLAAWMSSLILLPFSIYLTSRATKDRSLLDLDAIFIPFKKLIQKTQIDKIQILKVLDKNSEAFSRLNGYSNKKLIDVLKNYRQYGLDSTHKNTALHVLNTRGVSEQELRFGGNLVNETYESALRFKNNYDDNSKIGLLFYGVSAVMLLSGGMLNNNSFPVTGKILIGIGFFTTVFYIIAFIKTIISQSNFYKTLNKKVITPSIIFIILGIPLYFLYVLYFNRKIKEDLKQIK